jgi:NAD(P)H-dependent flavin oxidoreductase YrpB (nitropropane dioxygenase family)
MGPERRHGVDAIIAQGLETGGHAAVVQNKLDRYR